VKGYSRQKRLGCWGAKTKESEERRKGENYCGAEKKKTTHVVLVKEISANKQVRTRMRRFTKGGGGNAKLRHAHGREAINTEREKKPGNGGCTLRKKLDRRTRRKHGKMRSCALGLCFTGKE